MSDDHQKEAAKLGFDLTKQFLTLAFAGIAFVVGMAASQPNAISTALIWWAIGLFAASAMFGLLLLMRWVNRLNEEKSFDVYAISLRVFSSLQIVCVAVGVALLCPMVGKQPAIGPTMPGSSIDIKLGGSQTLSYPIEPDKNVTIEFDGTKFTFSATKP